MLCVLEIPLYWNTAVAAAFVTAKTAFSSLLDTEFLQTFSSTFIYIYTKK